MKPIYIYIYINENIIKVSVNKDEINKNLLLFIFFESAVIF